MVSRIKQLLDWQQLSPTQFADRIGVGRPVVSHILSERNKPSLEVVQRIIAAFPSLSLPWLLSGSGEMLAAATAPAPSAPEASATATVAGIPAAPAEPLTPPLANAVLPKATVSAAEQPRVHPAPSRQAPVPARFAAPRTVDAAVAPAAPVAGRFVPPGPRAAPLEAEPAAAEKAPADFSPVTVVSAAPDSGPASVVISSPEGASALPSPVPTSANIIGLPQALAGSLSQPDKAIRRIVIFYSDGSFSDFRPEN